MRVLCLIDCISGAGAQRQICRVADLVQRQGHDVLVLSYRPPDTFGPWLDRRGILRRRLEGDSGVGRFLAIRRAVRGYAPDAVLAFLPMPALYAELAAMPARRWGLVVSERSSVPGPDRWPVRLRRNLHRLADAVTTNSHTNRRMIESSVPALVGRVVTIYNAVDFGEFRPADRDAPRPDGPIRLAVAANYRPVKNPLGVVRALEMLRSSGLGSEIVVDWYGDATELGGSGRPFRRDVDEAVRTADLGSMLRTHDRVERVAEVYRQADGVLMPSYYEGLPNAVCEAMACGRPVLGSSVSDIPLLVDHKRTGLLFDPKDPLQIADAMRTFIAMSPSTRAEMGRVARRRAESMFDEKRICDAYLSVLQSAAERRRPDVRHWIPDPAVAPGTDDR